MTPTTTHSYSMIMPPVVVVVAAAVLVVQCLLLPVAGDVQFVRATCAKTEKPGVCTSVLLANSSSLTEDLFGLTTISGEALLTSFTRATAYLQQVASDTPPSQLKNILMACVDGHNDTIPQIQDALDSLAARRLRDAEEKITFPAATAVACEEDMITFNLTYPEGIRVREEGYKAIAYNTMKMIQLLESAS